MFLAHLIAITLSLLPSCLFSLLSSLPPFLPSLLPSLLPPFFSLVPLLFSSLPSSSFQPITVGDVNVRVLAYNWLGQTLYFAGRVERGGVGRVGVWVYHTINDRVEEVFVGDSLLMGERLRLAVDPFRG